ncbi:MAG: phenylacetic acid degradation operon negative regulatory protein PaaX [Gammaproteobacteria bacterium]|jgi:phenylacetic acid degradation operon negative regulatory protein|nr:phenylacetic acid degradation operon negative regulatory protein PaaX [Gammaproteobacteria bacterium]MBK6584473.1 phenylacetic acid degradation operon negative regulatory protein PaaX [Gammaproteobacteria bacterium]MBK7727821.1 phenylacetic acid degradation operon negative regulatory protein PaaX [Gammaproteobacteria bacterium]
MSMPRIAAIENLVAQFIAQRLIRCTSLIVTLFGDVVSQHGGVIWLGSMVEALSLLGVDERLVRTSTFRLVQEGWLQSARSGRRSFYRFTDYGRHEYERAARRIYALEHPRWDGSWTLLLPVAVPEEARERFRRSVRWAGFGSFAPNVFAHPGSDNSALTGMLSELGLIDKVVVMQAGSDALQSDRLIRELLWENWDLEDLAANYQQFLHRFRGVARAIARARTLAPEQCFKVRLLLIHEYRRILLHDTDLPAELLPKKWPGSEARQLAVELYRRLAPGSERYIIETLQAVERPMPASGDAFGLRFGN